MADLIIGGNTYKNVDFIKFQKTDGKIAIFSDTMRKDQRQPDASVSYLKGKPMRFLSAIANLGILTANVIKEN